MKRAALTPLSLLTWESPRRQPPTQAWMLTFADLTSLLLCFFVLFYATLVVDTARWQTLVGSLAANFAPATTIVSTTPSEQGQALPVVRTERRVEYLAGIQQHKLRADPVWANWRGQSAADQSAMVYAVPAALTNPSDPTAAAAWRRLGAALVNWQTPRTVRVVVPPNGDWQAAATRAWALAELAQSGGGEVTAEVVGGTLAAEGLTTEWVLYATDY